ncbi:MAG: 2-C-methyl-D-erythritol 4-phosphate cytidylyltransferase [Prevotella sp.]|nr:2-C-methyl-D-erythritol 4-phosphate cytidylyltransferase [Prevotella sp.]
MNIGIILSGGVGTRMGAGIPKQYMEVANTPIIGYCLDTFIKHPMIDKLIVGCAEEWREFVKDVAEKLHCEKSITFAIPGETRQYSIFNALKVAADIGADEGDRVIIHDAARPLVSATLIASCLEACKESDGVLPVIPVKDTIYQSRDGIGISNLLNRNELFAGQAPEAFVFGKYYALHKAMTHEELVLINGSTEIAFKGGMSIKLIRGDEMNFKITTSEDLSNFKNIIQHRQR